MLRKQQEEVERIRARRKRGGFINKKALRNVLNILFLATAVVGFALYFQKDHHDTGLFIIIAGMGIKILEFLIRFLG